MTIMRALTTVRGGEGENTHKSRPFARLAAVLVASHLLDRWPRKPPLRTIRPASAKDVYSKSRIVISTAAA